MSGMTKAQERRLHAEFVLPDADQAQAEVGRGVAFERVRRITGYLVGTLERFNNAKRAEEQDRVKHG